MRSRYLEGINQGRKLYGTVQNDSDKCKCGHDIDDHTDGSRCTICGAICEISNESDPDCARCDHPKSDHVQSGECQECLKSGNEHKFVKAQNESEIECPKCYSRKVKRTEATNPKEYKCQECGFKFDPSKKNENDTVKCRYCEKSFDPEESDSEKYCSKACQDAAREDRPSNENSKCNFCQHEMGDHNAEGTCGVCGNQCG